jgi:hypothetical protein
MDASTASAASVIRMGRQRDKEQWLVFGWFITLSLFLSFVFVVTLFFIFLSLLDGFGLLFLWVLVCFCVSPVWTEFARGGKCRERL